MGALDNIVFKKKKFSDILSEIYDNQKRKEAQEKEHVPWSKLFLKYFHEHLIYFDNGVNDLNN